MNLVAARIALVVMLAARLSAETAPRVAIYLGYQSDPSPQVAFAMQREVEDLFQPAGLQLHWLDLSAISGRDAHAHLYVVRLKGNCHARGLQVLFSELGPYGDPMVLGSAHTVDHTVLPFGVVECDRVRHAIAQSTIGFPEREREALLGRALGRVVAHELFHMMSGRPGHGRRGVFKRSQHRHELIGPRFEFDREELAQLRELAAKLRAR